jgi:hypothetical protein
MDNFDDKTNEKLVNIGDFLESIVWSSLDKLTDKSYLSHFQV